MAIAHVLLPLVGPRHHLVAAARVRRRVGGGGGGGVGTAGGGATVAMRENMGNICILGLGIRWKFGLSANRLILRGCSGKLTVNFG